MGGDDIGGDGETETGAATVADAALVEADEPSHDVVAPAGGDAGAVVVDVERHGVAVAPDGDAGDRRRVPGCVADDVIDGAAHCSLVADHVAERRVVAGDFDRNPPGAGGDVTGDVGERERRAVETALVAASEQQQVVDQALQPVELVEQDAADVPAQSLPGSRRATSSSVRITATGVRSSCDASDTSRRFVVDADPTARACRSSSWPTRRSRRWSRAPAPARGVSREPIDATRDVTAWTGRRARPASSHANPATSATSAGPSDPQQRPRRVDRVAHIVQRGGRGEHEATDTQRATEKSSARPATPSTSALADGNERSKYHVRRQASTR